MPEHYFIDDADYLVELGVWPAPFSTRMRPPVWRVCPWSPDAIELSRRAEIARRSREVRARRRPVRLASWNEWE